MTIPRSDGQARLHRLSVPILLVAQASSEQSISFAMRANHADEVMDAVRSCFERELERRYLLAVNVKQPCSIIAAIGENDAKLAHALSQVSPLTAVQNQQIHLIQDEQVLSTGPSIITLGKRLRDIRNRVSR